MRQIHIIGCSPRSGTTLLHEMMISCFEHDHHCTHEVSLLNCDDDVLASEGISITKEPNEALIAEQALSINPNLYIVFVRRDPRDVIVSKHKREPDRYFTNLGIWKHYESAIKNLSSHPRFLTIKYEDLVRDPDKAQAHIMKVLPWITKKAPFSSFTDHAQPSTESINALNGLRPASTSSIGRWRRHPQRVANQLALHGPVTSWLITHNYECSDQWLKELPPGQKIKDSYLADSPSVFTRFKKWRRRNKRLLKYRWRLRNLRAVN